MRPVITGWFSEFHLLEQGPDGSVNYGPGPDRFAGATYDPTSHYRAAAVFDFFERHGLTPEMLRQVSQHQVGLLAQRFDDLGADPRVVQRDASLPLSALGGFLALRARGAAALGQSLREGGVWVDARGDSLRLGAAQYLSDAQLEAAMECLRPLARSARA